ncbi:hypothetical protein KCU93_g3532, partial [Aureobasidium melanogenum]
MEQTAKITVLFVGAGNIAFGNDNVLWNHSQRIENRLGANLQVIGIVDPSIERVTQVLEQKQSSLAASCYVGAQQYHSVEDAKLGLAKSDLSPDLVVLGSPPYYRGTEHLGRDLELQIIAAFGPACTIFAEKPVSTARPEQSFPVVKALAASGNAVSVGYMLRYLKVVQHAITLIKQEKVRIQTIGARYTCAYSKIRKIDWWDKAKQCGPIVEQATHFADLCRYIGGEVELSTVNALALEYDEESGSLSSMAVDESIISEEDRIPRATTAFWKYENGALGTLTHNIALHGIRYSNEIIITGDGYQLRLVDLYTTPTLHIRSPESEAEKTYTYPHDDPFYAEFAVLLNSIEARKGVSKEPSNEPFEAASILSSYEDACKTYELTWRIRDASEESTIKRRQGVRQ